MVQLNLAKNPAIIEEIIDWSRPWDEFCDWVESLGAPGNFVANHLLRHVLVDAPVMLGFCFTCCIIYFVQVIFGIDRIGRLLGVYDVWRLSLLQITSLFTHVLAHSDYNHLRGNMMNLLLVGPSVEHEFGSKNLIKIIVVVAISSALAHIFVGRTYSHQLGASGVVFACILLNSLVAASAGKIPMSFVITFVMYIGDELWRFFFSGDTVSHHAHLVGGMVGALAGFQIHQDRTMEMTKRVFSKWYVKKDSAGGVTMSVPGLKIKATNPLAASKTKPKKR
ncbi:hypothetical protein MPSEU_000591200 [Mayamaea pseudoterrestris]|nr:hypothetical protein MPSEU_000591200 [Mayamaea pseudoterrestris]